MDLPYIVEYAKSGRAACKTCKKNIGKDSLRMGVMIQSPNFDGMIPLWHHLACFFQKQVVKNVADIANFDNLRWDDQNKIKEKIKNGPTSKSAENGSQENSQFSIEYAKTSRASCRTCGEKIQKTEIRISKLITDTPEAKRYGPMPGWRHVDCFIKDRCELEFTDAADKLPGFKKLEDDDKTMLLKKIGPLSIKRKIEEPMPTKSKKVTKEEVLMKSQNDLLFDIRDKLKAADMDKKELIELLEYNKQHISTGEPNLRDHLSDCLVFGAMKTCPECKSSAPRYKVGAYRCSGNLTEWTKCQYVTKCPERQPFKIPKEYAEKYDFLANYKYVKRDRILPESKEADSISKGPLSGLIFVVFGKFKSSKAYVEKELTELGAAVSQKIDSSVKCCISTQKDLEKGKSAKVKSAKQFDIHIVSPKFIEDVKNGMAPVLAIKENLICDWGGDPVLKLGIKQENARIDDAIPSTSKSGSSTKSYTVKVQVQGGAAVDPESGLAGKCHVYEKKGDIYNCVLGIADLSRGLNTYYKLQILEPNSGKKCYVFRSWGRVGTSIGNNKLQNFNNVDEAIKEFKYIYFDKTGNEWEDRKNFVKKPGKLYPLDIDYGQDKPELKALKPGGNCKLPKPVQDLICLIFDIEAMKKAMVEFEIDLKKMPLGKLSKKQIEQAYSVLSEAQQIINTGANANKVLDVSNRFYTLIPHDFGLRTPPKLDNEDLIKSKIEMLESLMEIELAYSMLVTESTTKDPVTEHYEQLATDIDVLDKNSEEFKVIEKYVKNTHAKTHTSYSLVLNKVFKINRHGENERYQKFKELHNKKLLWHGSRLTNYVGILSQGLRIAPPEAPVTGYMFGKGVYFADMVSKSANYCFTTQSNSTGLLLLCEVALGNMYEKTHSEYVERLPKDKHSTKGLGMTIPDPKETTAIDGVEVPYGKPVPSGVKNSSLLYNEYIVYDVNQINIKYLLDVTFKWKY